MRLSRNHLGGYFVIFIGIIIFMGVTGLDFLIGPLIFACAGLFFIRKKRRWLGLICFALSVIILFETVFHIDIGGLFVAGFFIFIGYRLLKGKSRSDRRDTRQARRHEESGPDDEDDNLDSDTESDWLDEEIEKLHEKHRQNKQQPGDDRTHEDTKQTEKQTEDGSTVVFKTPMYRSSLIGDFRLMNNRFELDDLNLSNFIGDVKIDLSKAIIPEGESTLVISGFIGDVDIYVPYDLDVSVSTSVTLGDLDVLGHKQGGFNRQIYLATKGYPQSSRKVKISVSVFIGDVDVRFL